jgi:hypothetical protein
VTDIMNRQTSTTVATTDTGRFPGRRLTGISMIAAPALLVAGAALLIGIYGKNGGEQLQAISDNTARAHAAVNLAIAGTVLAAFALAGLAAVVARHRPRAGHVGGALAIIGLFGPAFFLGVNYLNIQLADIADRAGAVTALDDAESTLNIVNICGPALLIGLLVLAAGAAKSGVLPRSASIALGLSALAPLGLLSGVIVISIVAWLALAVALMPLGLRTLREGSPPSATLP